MTKSLLLRPTLALLLSAAIMASAFAQQSRRDRRPPEKNALKVGQLAPTFLLKSLDGAQSFDLREYRDKKPVILFFGSYT